MSNSDFSKNVSLAEALTVAGLIVKVGRVAEENGRAPGYPVTWNEAISVELTQAQVPADARIVNFRDGDFLVATDCARIRDGVFPYLKNTVTEDWFPVIFEYLGETVNYGEVQELIAKLKNSSQQPTSLHRDERIIHTSINETLEAIEKLVVERKKATLTLSAPPNSLLSILDGPSHPVNIYSVTKSVTRDKKCGSSVKVHLTFGGNNGRTHSAVVTHKVLGKNEVVLKRTPGGDSEVTWLLSWD